MADTDNAAKGGLFATEVPGTLSGSYEFIGKAVTTLEENIETVRAEVQDALSSTSAAQAAAEEVEQNVATAKGEVEALRDEAVDLESDTRKLAINAEDSQYTLSDNTTGYSALHYKNKAEDARTEAQIAQGLAEDARDDAQDARDDAQAALDEFTDLYLGKKTSDPSLDNDGNALQDGALYFDTTNNVLKVYDQGNTTWKRTTPTTAQQAAIDSAVANENNINAVVANANNINKVAAIDSDVTLVADIDSDVSAVALIDSDVTAVNNNSANINKVAAIDSDVTDVAAIDTAVTAVNNNSVNINKVAAIDSDVTAVALIESDVTAVANISQDIQDVQDKLAEIKTAADDLNEATSEIDTVANSIANVDTVGTNITNVNTVATNISNVNTVGTNISSVNDFAARYRVSATEPTTSLDEGDLWFDTAADVMKVYGGGGWANAGSSVNGTSARFKYIATSGQTTFTGADANGVTLAYDAGYIDVYLNGVHLDPSDYTATSGSSVILASGAALNDELYIVAFGTFSVATHVTKSGDSMTGNLSFGDNDKAIFGAGSDLQIYHDGSHSRIYDNGGGELKIMSNGTAVRIQKDSGENMILANTDGAVNLYYDSSAKLATTSTGIDVTGTVTADGLTVDGNFETSGSSDAFGSNSSSAYILRTGSTGSTPFTQAGALVYQPRTSTTDGRSNHLFYTGDPLALRMNIQPTGDISFYDTEGENAKFFWDASAESLGIGTSSPATPIHINSSENTLLHLESTDANVYLKFTDSNSVNAGYIGYVTDDMEFWTNNAERMRIDSSGNVGIGTSSPLGNFHVNGGGSNMVALFESTDSKAFISVRDDSTTLYYGNQIGCFGDDMYFATANTERMRIDSSGNLLVGTTSNTLYSTSTETGSMIGDGVLAISANNPVAYFNRITADGDTVQLRRDGNITGRIGSNSSRMYVGSGGVGVFFDNLSYTAIRPYSPDTQTSSDATITLGHSTNRFKNLYLSGGVYLGGTGSANYLEDYEEGTFTPSISFSGDDVGITYTARGGKYIKVGDMVTVWIYIYLGNKGSSTGQVRIHGLPFATGSTHTPCFSPMGDRGYLDTGGRGVSVYVFRNTGYFPLYSGGFNGTPNASVTNSAVGNNTEFDVVVSYPVS
jgi:prefoldin subunit 5